MSQHCICKPVRDLVLKAIIRWERDPANSHRTLDDSDPCWKRTHLTRHRIHLVLGVLESEGLVEPVYEDDETLCSVQTTNAGACYFELHRDAMWAFFRRSILVPILVAFLTSVLTSSLWPQILDKICSGR